MRRRAFDADRGIGRRKPGGLMERIAAGKAGSKCPIEGIACSRGITGRAERGNTGYGLHALFTQ